MRFAHRSDFRLSAAVVMNDHVHAVVTPNRGHQLTAIQHSWKSFSAFRLQRESGRRGKIWQDEAYDRIVRDDPALNRFVAYIRLNPSRRWPEIRSYPWLWLGDAERNP